MTSNLPALPFEIWGCIGSYLSNADIKTFRLACSQFNNAVYLRLDRVFLSANPPNIEVFCSIASHEKFRHKVTEIIWDEARLPRGPRRTTDLGDGHELLSDEDEPDNAREWAKGYGIYAREKIIERHQDEEKDGCPKWFKNACEENFRYIISRKSRDVDRPDHVAQREQILARPPLSECWQHYQHLLRQQKDVLAGTSDQEAFLFGLKQFPALKRVTITPAAHGHLFAPLYATPMIRAFPKGFTYAVPRGWLYPESPIIRSIPGPATAYEWNEHPELRERYRGFRTVIRVLANANVPNPISELVMTANLVPTGVNCMIFAEPCEEYDNFATALRTLGLRRLDISLLIGCCHKEDIEDCWPSLLNGRLRRALSEARELEEFRLHTTLINDPYDDDDDDGLPSQILLQSIMPVEKWPKLRHFELSGFLVSRYDIVSFLAALPKSIRSIELSMLGFLDEDGGGWYSALEDIRESIRENALWEERDATSRPKLTIGLPLVNDEIGRNIWIEKEVSEFIYGEGENPFEQSCRCNVPFGVGTQKDSFDPNFERPLSCHSVKASRTAPA
jgi:hypothetical protein